MGTFRKNEQKFVAVKYLAAATYFPLKIPWIPFIKGKIPFFCKITQKASTLRNIIIEVWNLAWIILISVPKKLFSRFLIFWAVATLLRGIPSKKGKTEGISLNKVATAQNIKNPPASNFLETFMRKIHAKFQTSMTMLRRVDAFAWFRRKRDFSLYKGNSRDFQ